MYSLGMMGTIQGEEYKIQGNYHKNGSVFGI